MMHKKAPCPRKQRAVKPGSIIAFIISFPVSGDLSNFYSIQTSSLITLQTRLYRWKFLPNTNLVLLIN